MYTKQAIFSAKKIYITEVTRTQTGKIRKSVCVRKLVQGSKTLLSPVKLRDRVVDLAHKRHQGLTKTKQRLRSKVSWCAGLIDKLKQNARSALAVS